MTRKHRVYFLPLVLTAAVMSLVACGSSDDGGKVASLGADTASAAPAASGDLEKQVDAYVECLRKQGLDLPDPTIDAKGQISFGRPANGQSIDRDKMTAAQTVCGKPPAGITSAAGADAQDPAFQDAAVKFAGCMRGQGVNVPDPDFSKVGTGSGSGAAGLFGGIDRDDPKVQAAIKACQSVWTAAGVQPPGAAGGN